jgi:hypothetical protein
MSRIEVLTHKGKKIVFIDLAQCSPTEVLQVIEKAKVEIAKCGPKGALILTDVSGATYTKEIAAAMKDFTQFNSPYVKASAVVGADGIRGILLNTIIFITRRELKTFMNREEAKNWLVEQNGSK